MLALVGSGEYLPGMEPVDRELLQRLPEPWRVVCLPTAAGQEGEERIDYWSQLGIQHFQRLGAQVEALPIIDRESADDLESASRVRQANFVYFSGGKPDYLHKSLAGSLTWQAVEAVLEGGGVVAGCSAGAMIMGEVFYGFPGWKDGFNLMPGAVLIPHFDEIPSLMLSSIHMTMRKSLTLLGVDGYTALVKNGSGFEVLGRGGVTVWNREGKTRHTQGPLAKDW